MPDSLQPFSLAFPLELARFTQDLQDRAYTYIPFAYPKDKIKMAVQSFMAFLELPNEVKQHIDFSISPLHRRGDVGYKHRTSADGSYNDTKDFFHFHPALFDRYEEFLRQEPQVNKFVQEAHAIWKVVFQTTQDVLGVMDRIYPGTSSKVLDTQYPHILLRFLRYHWKESQECLAKPHFDAGSFTIAIAESGPGLRIGKSPESLVPVHHHADSAILMMASNQAKLLPESPWPPGWHDVVQLDERYLGHPYARWAVVAFIDAHGVDALPKSQTLHWHS